MSVVRNANCTMKVLLNIIWHFPFFGFMTAFVAFFWGIIFCITIVGFPIGWGLIQFSKFLLAPFGRSMISSRDIAEATTSDSGTSVYQIFALIVRIVYFPFGLLSCIFAFFQGLSCCLTIIGIPVGVVIFKSLGTFFNPVNKVCVGADFAQQVRLYNDAIRSGASMEKPEALLAYERQLKEEEAKKAEFQKRITEFSIKYKWYLFVGTIGLLIALCIMSHYTSDEYRQKKAYEYLEKEDYKRAAKYFHKLDGSKYRKLEISCYDSLGDVKSAAKALLKEVDNNDYDGMLNDKLGLVLITGDYEPFIKKDRKLGFSLFDKKWSNSNILLLAGISLFYQKDYMEAENLLSYVEREGRGVGQRAAASGFLGLIHLYGLGGKRAGAEAIEFELESINDKPCCAMIASDVMRFSIDEMRLYGKSGKVANMIEKLYKIRKRYAIAVNNAGNLYVPMAKYSLMIADSVIICSDYRSYASQKSESSWGHYKFVDNGQNLFKRNIFGASEYIGMMRSNLAHGWGIVNCCDEAFPNTMRCSIWSKFDKGRAVGYCSIVKCNKRNEITSEIGYYNPENPNEYKVLFKIDKDGRFYSAETNTWIDFDPANFNLQ